jgi:hypothetical protein
VRQLTRLSPPVGRYREFDHPLGDNIGMRTAELETKAQRAYLQSEGCTEPPGFLIGRSLLSARLGALFTRADGVRFDNCIIDTALSLACGETSR